MNDFFKIVLTAGTTLIGGTSLLVLSKIFVEPVHELKKIMGEIAAYVFKSHNLLANVPDPDENEIRTTIEKLQEFSARFRALINTIPWFSLFVFLRILRPKNDLLKAAEVLSTISYAPFESDKEKVSQKIDELYSLLGFKMSRQ